VVRKDWPACSHQLFPHRRNSDDPDLRGELNKSECLVKLTWSGNGVLTITMPKRKEAKAKAIKVQTK
jgi:hypothetical protein